MSYSTPGGVANGSVAALLRPLNTPEPVIQQGGPSMDPSLMLYVMGPEGAGGVRKHTPLDAGAFYQLP